MANVELVVSAVSLVGEVHIGRRPESARVPFNLHAVVIAAGYLQETELIHINIGLISV